MIEVYVVKYVCCVCYYFFRQLFLILCCVCLLTLLHLILFATKGNSSCKAALRCIGIYTTKSLSRRNRHAKVMKTDFGRREQKFCHARMNMRDDRDISENLREWNEFLACNLMQQSELDAYMGRLVASKFARRILDIGY